MARPGNDDSTAQSAAPPEEITVDRQAEIPIGVQIAWAVRSRIAEGNLPAGSRLPTLRELAETTGVNVNTIRAVYQRLEQERLIESRQGSGTFVSEHGERATVVGSIAALAASEAESQGVDPRSVAAALYAASSSGATAADEAFARRRALRAQIATLERAVTELESTHLMLASAPPGATGNGPTLLDTVGLEGVRSQLLRRLVAIQEAIDDDTVTAPATRRSGAGAGARSPAGRKSRRGSGDDAAAAQPENAPARGRAKQPGRATQRPATA